MKRGYRMSKESIRENRQQESALQPAIDSLPAQVGTGPLGIGMVNGITTVVATLSGPAAPAIYGTSAAMQAFGESITHRAAQKDQQVLGQAAIRAALDPEELLRKVANNDAYLALTAQAIDAARRSQIKEKARALGNSLGAILEDDARLDEEAVWISILAQLDRQHIRVMKLFLYEGKDPVTGQPKLCTGSGQKVSSLCYESGLGDAVLPLVQDLVLTGILVTSRTIMNMEAEIPDTYETRYKASSLALDLLTRLDEHADGTLIQDN